MPGIRLMGFATLGCGCLVGRYRDPGPNREVDYVEAKGRHCWVADHQRNHPVLSEVLPPGAAAFVTPTSGRQAAR